MWVRRASIATAFVAAIVGAAPGLASADPTGPAPGPPTGPKTSIDADGTYAVNTDIVPGVYASAGPVADGTCYWKRFGTDGATIDNALTKKPQTVQIDATDQTFKTNGCQAWQLTDGPLQPQQSGLGPALAGLQLQAMMAQLNSRAAASGQIPDPTPAPAPAPDRARTLILLSRSRPGIRRV